MFFTVDFGPRVIPWHLRLLRQLTDSAGKSALFKSTPSPSFEERRGSNEYMNSENWCRGCGLNCCRRFSLASQALDPGQFQRQLTEASAVGIRKIGVAERVVTRGGRNPQRVAFDVFDCPKFDAENQQCTIHGTAEVPSFCRVSGDHRIKPNSQCRYKERKKEMIRQRELEKRATKRRKKK